MFEVYIHLMDNKIIHLTLTKTEYLHLVEESLPDYDWFDVKEFTIQSEKVVYVRAIHRENV